MKKSLICINILALFLTSCSSFKNTERLPAASELSCTEVVKDFFVERKVVTEEEYKSALNFELTAQELKDFFHEFAGADADVVAREADTFKAIFLYGKNDQKVRLELLKEFNNLLNRKSEDDASFVWKKFAAHKKKVDAKKEKMIAREKTEAGKSAARGKAEIFEKLYYSCKSQTRGMPTAQELKQAKKLTYALAAGSFGSSLITYSGVHWEEEKNQKWFNELYFSLGIGLAFSFISGKLVMANPNLNPWTGKMPLAFLNNAVSDAGVSGVYGFLFQADDSELEKKLKALESDPEANKKLQELMVIAEENHLFEKHLKNTQDLFKDKRTNKTMNPADFDHEVTMDDIDIEESRELLMDALAEQEYQEKSGMLKTGQPAVDRFTFHRIYNLFSVPTSIGLTILMNNQMCMTENPKKGFMKAVGIYLGASILMDSFYFKSKKEVINQ